MNKLADERYDKIFKLSEKIDFSNLTYHCKALSADIKFDNFDDAFIFSNKIRYGELIPQDAK